MTEVTVQDPANTQPVVSFLKEKHELTTLLKSLDKASTKAIKLLTDTMDNAKTDEKTRLECANKIISFYMAASKQINDEDMARLIAQVRLGKPQGKSVGLTDGDKPPQPALDFTNIKKV